MIENRHWNRKRHFLLDNLEAYEFNIQNRTLSKAQDFSAHVRQRFLDIVHQCIKEHTVAGTLALAASNDIKDVQADAKIYLTDLVDSETLLRQTSAPKKMEGATLIVSPEYVLTYLVHILGHHPTFPMGSDAENEKAYEPFYMQLLFYPQALISQDRSGNSRKDDLDGLSSILAIFRAIKGAEDVVDKMFLKICMYSVTLASSLKRILNAKKNSSDCISEGAPLPSQFYKICRKKMMRRETNAFYHVVYLTGRSSQAMTSPLQSQGEIRPRTRVATPLSRV